MCKEHLPKSISENICVHCEKEIVYIPDYFPTIRNDKDYRKISIMGMSDGRTNGWLLKSIALDIKDIYNKYNFFIIKTFKGRNNFIIRLKFVKNKNLFMYVMYYDLEYIFSNFELYLLLDNKNNSYYSVNKLEKKCEIGNWFEPVQSIMCNVDNLEEAIIFLEKLMSNIEFL